VTIRRGGLRYMFWRPHNDQTKGGGRYQHGIILCHAQGSHPHVLLLGDGNHEVIRHLNFKPLPSSPELRAMLEACEDDSDS
jgi:hypothetical protein